MASGATILRFKYTSGSSYTGDFALDDIQGPSLSGTVQSCTSQSNCATDDTTAACVLTSNYYCGSPSPGYYVSGCIVQSCTTQTGCATHDTTAACVSTSSYYCSTASPGYYLLSGTVITSSFEADLDGWTTGSMDRPFYRQAGSTGSISTGPQGAAIGSYYVYCETSTPNYPSANFDMSRIVTVGSVSGLTFQYHMYGAAMGTATLEAYTGAGWISAWTKSGNLGNAWQQASVTVASGTTMLSFKYTGESSYTGDFALDDIQSTGGDDTHSYSYSYGDLF